MKLLFLSGWYPPRIRGGGEISTHLIAQGLRQRGHEVQVITEGMRRLTRELDGVSILELPVSLTAKPLLERRHSRRIAKTLAREIDFDDYDVVHAHDFRSAQALSELKLPHAVVTARDYAQICGSPNNLLADGTVCPGCQSLANVRHNRAVVEASLIRKPFRIWQYRYNIGYRLSSFRTFRQQIFISQAQQEEIARQQDLTQTATHVIYNPVRADYLEVPTASSTGRQLLFLGTVESYKGVGLLLEAFRELAQHDPAVQLKIVGEGAQRAQYERQVVQWGLGHRVAFIGRVPYEGLRRLYDEASIVVSPHLWVEPFGRTVVEAMARGRIVVAANSGGPAEVVEDGVTGLLFESGSVESLRETLQRGLNFSEGQRAAMSRAARAWVMEHLKVDEIARQYEVVYQKMMTG